MTLLSVTHDISRDGVLECRPRRLSINVNLRIDERVLRVLHLGHFRKQVMVAVISPTLVRVSALEDSERIVIHPDLCCFILIILFKAGRTSCVSRWLMSGALG